MTSAPPPAPHEIGATCDDVPPPSAALDAAVRAARPVRLRRPWVSLALAALLTAAWPLSMVFKYGLRRDWAFLPMAFTWGFGALWIAAMGLTLSAAFLPPKAQVLPDGYRAGRYAFLAAVVLTVGSALFTAVAPGHTLMSPADSKGFWLQWWRCTFFSLQITATLFVVGGLLLRKLAPVRRGWLGAGLGGAGGAFGGLVLHLLCPVGDPAHVALSHGGGVALGALLGAVLIPLALRESKRSGS